MFASQVRTTRSTAPRANQDESQKLREQKKKVSHLKNIDSKLANVIMDEVLER